MPSDLNLQYVNAVIQFLLVYSVKLVLTEIHLISGIASSVALMLHSCEDQITIYYLLFNINYLFHFDAKLCIHILPSILIFHFSFHQEVPVV